MQPAPDAPAQERHSRPLWCNAERSTAHRLDVSDLFHSNLRAEEGVSAPSRFCDTHVIVEWSAAKAASRTLCGQTTGTKPVLYELFHPFAPLLASLPGSLPNPSLACLNCL